MGDEALCTDEMEEIEDSEDGEAASRSEYTLVSDSSRIDVQLSRETNLTRSRIAGLIKEGKCLLDGTVVSKAGVKPKSGSIITLFVPPPEEAVPEAENIPLEILYEDNDIIVVVKPAGMVVHPANGNENGTLVNALLYHMQQKGEHFGDIGGVMRPGIVHRLDKDTSGVMVVAKNNISHVDLCKQLSGRTMEKHYRALVEDVIKDDEGRIDAPIGRSKTDRKKMALDMENGRKAVTLWRVITRGKGCTLLDVHILTGRTHQIRVHMKSIGHSVCGDVIYGRKNGVSVPRLMLHAYTLSFNHPLSGERMTFTAPLPKEFIKGLEANGIKEEKYNG